MVWQQNYDPFGTIILSCLVASIPVVLMMAMLGFRHVKAHHAAPAGLVSALVISIAVFGMPAQVAGPAAGYGAAFDLLPIGWIVPNIICLHQLAEEDGSFKVLLNSLSNHHRRPQAAIAAERVRVRRVLHEQQQANRSSAPARDALFNREGAILRYVFFHSIALAMPVGVPVTLMAYV